MRSLIEIILGYEACEFCLAEATHKGLTAEGEEYRHLCDYHFEREMAKQEHLV